MRLTANAENDREARRFVGTRLQSWDSASVTDIAVLLTSEIVTNAVLHAGPHDSLTATVLNLSQSDGVTRVEVVDANVPLPVVGDRNLDRKSGRGLLLLDALADSWGVTAGGDGKLVWFEVNATPDR